MKNTSIDFTSFKNRILEDLRQELGEEYIVFSHMVRKNNGIELTGIVARRSGCNASPTIYLDPFYHEEMTEGEMTEIAERLTRDFRKAEIKEDMDLSGFLEFKQARERLAFRLINREKNRELLKEIPYKTYFNLAVVFYYSVQEPPFCGKAAILIHNTHMKLWNTNVDELFQIAFQNTPKLFPSKIESMETVMKEVLAEGLLKDLPKGFEEREEFTQEWVEEILAQMTGEITQIRLPMYVLTNSQKLYGAVCMLYPGVLKAFAEKLEQDFYVLPSSVHETILVPAGKGTDKDTLREIVTDINRTQVAEDEVLADSVYYYSRSKDQLIWIA